MLAAGDKILVVLSGGMDSIDLMELFLMRRERIPISFDLFACSVSAKFIDADKRRVFDCRESEGIHLVVE
ncbi:MAG: hypothetical protein ABH858_03910 [Candidatus Omnitrophota bacterium]